MLACTKPVRADKRSRKSERSTQTTTKSECRARTGFPTPAYASNVSCDSKDGVRAGIEAKRNLVTNRQRRVIMRALVPTPAKPGRYQLPSDRRANKFDRGFPSVDDKYSKFQIAAQSFHQKSKILSIFQHIVSEKK